MLTLLHRLSRRPPSTPTACTPSKRLHIEYLSNETNAHESNLLTFKMNHPHWQVQTSRKLASKWRRNWSPEVTNYTTSSSFDCSIVIESFQLPTVVLRLFTNVSTECHSQVVRYKLLSWTSPLWWWIFLTQEGSDTQYFFWRRWNMQFHCNWKRWFLFFGILMEENMGNDRESFL